MRWIFTYKIVGEGNNRHEALEDALDAFMQDPGGPTEIQPIIEMEHIDLEASIGMYPSCFKEDKKEEDFEL